MEFKSISKSDFSVIGEMLSSEYTNISASTFIYMLENGSDVEVLGIGSYEKDRLVGFLFAYYRDLKICRNAVPGYILANGFIDKDYRSSLLYLKLNRILIEHLKQKGAQMIMGFTNRQKDYCSLFNMIPLERRKLNFELNYDLCNSETSKITESRTNIKNKFDYDNCYENFFVQNSTYNEMILETTFKKEFRIFGDFSNKENGYFWVGKKIDEVYKIVEISSNAFVEENLQTIFSFIKQKFLCTNLEMTLPNCFIQSINLPFKVSPNNSCVLQICSFPTFIKYFTSELSLKFSKEGLSRLYLNVVYNNVILHILYFDHADITLVNNFFTKERLIPNFDIEYGELVNVLLGFKQTFGTLKFINTDCEHFFWNSEQF